MKISLIEILNTLDGCPVKIHLKDVSMIPYDAYNIRLKKHATYGYYVILDENDGVILLFSARDVSDYSINIENDKPLIIKFKSITIVNLDKNDNIRKD